MYQSPETPFEHMARYEVAFACERVVQTLTPREKKTIVLRFAEDMTFEEMAPEFELSANSMRQIVGKALRKLRHASRRIPLEEAAFGRVVEEELQIEDALQRAVRDQERRDRDLQDFLQYKTERAHRAALAQAIADEKRRQEELERQKSWVPPEEVRRRNQELTDEFWEKRSNRMLAARKESDEEVRIQLGQKKSLLDSLIKEAAEAASEGDTAWLEFVDELEPHELELMNKEVDYVIRSLGEMGIRLELRMP